MLMQVHCIVKTTYFFICFVKLEVQSGIQLRCILSSALQHVYCACDT